MIDKKKLFHTIELLTNSIVGFKLNYSLLS